MSWLVSSIANSLKPDDDEQIPPYGTIPSARPEHPSPPHTNPADGHTLPSDSFPSDHTTSPRRGVKEDLSDLSKTLTRQLWGVASFLAPPPNPEKSDPNRQQPSDEPEPDASSSAGIAEIRSHLSEIGGKFRSGISKLSTNKTVSEFTKIASNFLQFESEVGEYARRGVVGVTEEVVAFARDIAMHPKTWVDFPLPNDGEEDPDFDLSDGQREHVLAVERLAPQLASLRIELCPGYMSEGCFWKIYFVLIHPRLTIHDAQLLSTPQIVRARAMLTSESQSHMKPEAEVCGRGNAAHDGSILAQEEHLSVPSSNPSDSVPWNLLAVEPPTSMEAGKVEVDKHPLESVEIPVIDKAVAEDFSAHCAKNEKSGSGISSRVEDEGDDGGDFWLKESEEIGMAGGTAGAALQDNDDVSFSDLEDDDDGEIPPIKYDNVDALQLSAGSRSDKELHVETKESNDWFDTDDIDVA